MSGTHEGGIKAARTVEREHPGFHREIGKKGAKQRHAKSKEEESRIAQQAAATRKRKDPDAFRKMGEKRGKGRKSLSEQ